MIANKHYQIVLYGVPAGEMINGEVTVAVKTVPDGHMGRRTTRHYSDPTETEAVDLGLQGRL